MNWIGRSSLQRADYSEANKWYLRALEAAGESNKEEAALSLHSLATIDLRRGEYDEARQKLGKALKITQQIGDRYGEAATWHQLASIDLNRGECDEARQKFETALKMRQQIGERYGEASEWRNLAMVDVRQKQYRASKEKFQKSLQITQQIGDKAGEGATFSQVGMMIEQFGRSKEGLRLASLGTMILRSVGHVDLKQVEPWVNALATQLQYTQEQFDAMLSEVQKSYQRDRGWCLIEAAFADLPPEPDKV